MLFDRHETCQSTFSLTCTRQIFLTGHGGDGFIKFQDVQELIDQDLADTLQQMHEKGRCVT